MSIYLLVGVSNLLSLGELSEPELLHTIRNRYTNDKIYTSIGPGILISINPYKIMDIYSYDIAQYYRNYFASN